MKKIIFSAALFFSFLTSSVSCFAAVGDLVAISVWRFQYNSIYYTSAQSYCTAYATNTWGGTSSCTVTGVTTSTDKLSQTWAFNLFSSNTATASPRTVSASAWCDPTYYAGPASYAGNGTYQCKVTVVPPSSCSATDNVAARDITIGWATGPSTGAAATYLYKANTSTDFMKSAWCVDSCVQVAKSIDGVHSYQDQKASPNGYFRIFAQSVPMSQIGGGSCTIGTNAGQAPDVKNVVTEPTTPNTFNGSCPTGSVPGGQSPDGMTICVGKATQAPTATSSTTTTPTSTTTDSSGNTVSTSTKTQTNADGSTTSVTTTTTTAPDGTATTSTSSNTTAASGGQPGTTDKPDQPKDMCTLHPELTVCQNSQVQGSCALVTCTGDAIQCATLRAAATIQCKQDKDAADLAADPNAALGKSILSGADPMASQISTNNAGQTVNMSNSQLDQTGWLSGGSCLAPIVIQVLGTSITVPMDSICQSILPIRAAIMLMAFIISYLLVSRAVLRS